MHIEQKENELHFKFKISLLLLFYEEEDNERKKNGGKISEKQRELSAIHNEHVENWRNMNNLFAICIIVGIFFDKHYIS